MANSNSEKTFSFNSAIPADVENFLTLNGAADAAPQVKEFMQSVNWRGYKEYGLVGVGAAAACQIAAMNGAMGYPTITLLGFGRDAARVGSLNLNDYRHNKARPQREKLQKEAVLADGEYAIVDAAGRGILDFQISDTAELLGVEADSIRVFTAFDAPPQVDVAAPYNIMKDGVVVNTVHEALASAGLGFADWNSGRVILALPGLGTLAATVVVAAQAIAETMCPILGMRPEGERPNLQFRVREIVQPQDFVEWGAKLAAQWRAEGAPISISRSDVIRLMGLAEEAIQERVAAALGSGQDDESIDGEWLYALAKKIGLEIN